MAVYEVLLLTWIATLAFRECLPLPESARRRQRRVIQLFVHAGVIFRSEIALLLFTQLAYLLLQSAISVITVLLFGIPSATQALAITVMIDSRFWKQGIWPELAGFYFNAIQGKSAEWGTSPLGYYFTALLPRLLLNPIIIILLIPLSFSFPSTKFSSRDLVIPSVLFIAIYSLQPHKESRFIIYVVPPLTAAASLSASYIWTRRNKTRLYRLGSLLLVASIIGSFAASTTMLLISSLNYPGGEALSQLHGYLRAHPDQLNSYNANDVRIHMDVLSCMTGVTRFQQYDSWPRMGKNQSRGKETDLPYIDGKQMRIMYDKTEDEAALLLPAFWAHIDYALMEDPGKAIGAWEVIGTVYAYAGIEFLKPEYFGGWGDNLKK
jgi:alpha-1,6-mannosyltransferase